MTKGWLIKANLKRYQVEIDGKTHTFRNDIALGVVDEHNDDCYFVGTTYTPVDTDSCTDNGCVCWSRKEFGENVDTWSIIQQFFKPDRPRKSKSKRVQALREELNDK